MPRGSTRHQHADVACHIRWAWPSQAHHLKRRKADGLGQAKARHLPFFKKDDHVLFFFLGAGAMAGRPRKEQSAKTTKMHTKITRNKPDPEATKTPQKSHDSDHTTSEYFEFENNAYLNHKNSIN